MLRDDESRHSAPRRWPRTKSRGENGRCDLTWEVLILNDEVHTLAQAAQSIHRPTGNSFAESVRIALTAHHQMVAVVESGVQRERALFLCWCLQDDGFRSEVVAFSPGQ